MSVVSNNNNASNRRVIDTYRIQSSNYMLTWPQCNVTKEVVLERAKLKWNKELKSMLICRELHKDGTPHLHASLNFYKKKCFRGSNCFDFLTLQHGNYQKTRSYYGCLYYVLKHGDYINYNITDYDIEKAIEWGKKHTQTKDIIDKIVTNHYNYYQVRAEYMQFTFFNDKKLKTFINEQQIYEKQVLRPKYEVTFRCRSHEYDNNNDIKVENWLNENINKDRKLKQPQLYIHGETNCGKSTIVRFLRTYGFTPYMLPREEYFDLYDDNMYDFIWGDEFVSSQLPLQIINLLAEGDEMVLRTKGGQKIKTKNMPMIICSNIPLEECYKRCPEVARNAFIERFIEIKLEEYMNVDIFKV